jgi:hypothetical protein
MSKQINNSNNKKLPKVIELVSSLATFMDSETEYGQEYGMTKLSKEIKLNRPNGKIGSPSVGTIRDKLTEHFVLRDALKDWQPGYESTIIDGKKESILKKVRKIEPNEVNMERILNILIGIKEEQAKIRKEIEDIKKVIK